MLYYPDDCPYWYVGAYIWDKEKEEYVYHRLEEFKEYDKAKAFFEECGKKMDVDFYFVVLEEVSDSDADPRIAYKELWGSHVHTEYVREPSIA